MSSQAKRTLFALLVSGVVMRLAWVAQTGGLTFDMSSFRLVAEALGVDPIHLYGDLNPENVYRWPYPPGYFPWIHLSDALGDAGLLPFPTGIRLPAVLADAGLAWLVQAGLGRAGAPERTRLLGAAIVMLGPSFALVSGFHGQIDSVATLPAVAALLVWERAGANRAVVGGLLIGVAVTIKAPPGLVLLALLASVRSRREAATLLGAAAALPLLTLAPFLIADGAGVVRALGYGGIPGQGGLTLLVDPNLAHHFVQNKPGVEPNGIVRFLNGNGTVLTAVTLLAVAGIAARRRMGVRDTAVLLWLTFYVLGTGFSLQYAVWGLPFLLLAGRLRWAVVFQAGLLVPSLLIYAGPFKAEWLIPVYVLFMAGVWVSLAAMLVASLRARRPVAATA
jgi:hypothetical protein